MYFAPTIGGYNFYDKWHMIPNGKISLPPAPVKTNTIEVPGMNGEYDYTELMGGPTYGVREGDWEFIILNKVDPATGWYFQTQIDPDTVYKEVLSLIHGKRLTLKMDGDETTYNGRFSVSDFSHGKDYATLKISYKVDP